MPTPLFNTTSDSLVNQKATPTDDIPFGETETQNGDAGAGAPVGDVDPKLELTKAGDGPDIERRQSDAIERKHPDAAERAIEDRSKERIAQLTRALQAMASERESLQDQLKQANETIRQIQPNGTNALGHFRRLCFLHILEGIAASGDLSLGKVSNDGDVSKHIKHIAGLASFAARSAQDSKII